MCLVPNLTFIIMNYLIHVFWLKWHWNLLFRPIPQITNKCIFSLRPCPGHSEHYLCPPLIRETTARAGVTLVIIALNALSTSSLINVFDSPDFCNKTFTVLSSSWSMLFFRWVKRSLKQTTAARETPERKFFT